MTEFPTGTVTFLFTDIEGSTRLLRDLGAAAYEDALTTHRRQLRAAFAAHGGTEVDTQGDAFFYAFGSPAEGVAAAAAGQAALAAGPIRVRMGLHTGEARRTAEGYVGETLHLGARIAASGHGGQVLLSAATRDGLTVETTDLGEHRFKDFAEPVWVYQLGTDRFPPLKTISNTNLPHPASSFLGREREVAEVAAQLRNGARLLTLTGPGGTGKTRLAIEAAATLVPAFRNGTFWVELAPIRDPDLVPEAIGQVLGAKETLAGHIDQREMLLLVDNLEQVIDAAPGLADLVEVCPNLRLLVTSRERLRVRGEVEYPVLPLADPEAVALFTARSGVAADDTVADLCRSLDNLPLAIELAAARASVLTPAQIRDRLTRRLDQLKGGRDADPRQQTLRATIEWSYDLLTDDERGLFERVGVFAGGCDLDAAEAVVDADLDVLQSLVDKSLVRHTNERFWMLETIREFALERLEASGAASESRDRLVAYYLDLAEQAEPALRDVHPRAWLDRLGPENDNLRAALDWSMGSGDGERALRLAGSLDEFWCARNEYAEGRRHLARALELESRPIAARAKALTGAAHLARDSGDAVAGRQLAGEAVALQRTLDDQAGVGRATLWLGASLADAGEFAQAQQVFREANRISAEAGDRVNALFANRLLAWMYYELGDRATARTMHEANLIGARELGWTDLEGSILGALSEYAIDDGRFADAVDLAIAGIRLGLELGQQFVMADDVTKAANTLVHVGQTETAVTLTASGLAWHDEIGTPPLPYLGELIQRVLTLGREQLGEAAFDVAWQRGRRLAVDDAAALALSALQQTQAEPRVNPST